VSARGVQTAGGIGHDTRLPEGAPNCWLVWFNVAGPDAIVEKAASLASTVPRAGRPYRRSSAEGPSEPSAIEAP
jgi:uncharacterized protein